MRSYWPLILLLAAMWGASYLFIKVAVEDIPPAAMTELRVLVAGLLLAGYLVWRMGMSRAIAELRAAWRPVPGARRHQRRGADGARGVG